MKVIILAGGLGTRLSEETDLKPKPMINIGAYPILWHIMKIYSFYGLNDFIILLGYKGHLIKEYFHNYVLHNSDISIDMKSNSVTHFSKASEDWNITLLDTGLDTMTGGRILRAKKYIDDEEFLLTYGDGLADINIKKLIDFHHKRKKLVTLTAVQPQGRFGALEIRDDNFVSNFNEKPDGDGAWINGGFFVCDRKVIEYINDDSSIFEREPLTRLASENNLLAYKHHGFWHCMDTMRDKNFLNDESNAGSAKWKLW